MSPRHISEDLRRRVRQWAGDRCGYCRSPQHLVYGKLEIEHIVPVAKGGTDEEQNLCLSCRLCNSFKASQTEFTDPVSGALVRFFDPRRQSWADHFSWSDDGTRILGRTPCGRATILALRLNNWIALTVRRQWVSAGWHPPAEGQ
jgi:hypothetical protein